MRAALLALLVLGAIVATVLVARRSRTFIVFLSGAFLVSGGIQGYLAFVGVSVPIFGTGLVQTPAVGRVRAAVHVALFAVCAWASVRRGAWRDWDGSRRERRR